MGTLEETARGVVPQLECGADLEVRRCGARAARACVGLLSYHQRRVLHAEVEWSAVARWVLAPSLLGLPWSEERAQNLCCAFVATTTATFSFAKHKQHDTDFPHVLGRDVVRVTPRVGGVKWWYWYGPLWPLRILPDILGLSFLCAELGLVQTGGRTRTDFDFPILFIASEFDDRVAYTDAFVRWLQSQRGRRASKFLRAPPGSGHFFPQTAAPFVLAAAVPWVRAVERTASTSVEAARERSDEANST